MPEGLNRRTVQADVHRILAAYPDANAAEVVAVLAAFAGEVLATGDEAAIADLSNALSVEVLADHRCSDAIEAVLAMARTYSLRTKMRRVAPGSAPRRAYDPPSR
jgi:hypothetical protein